MNDLLNKIKEIEFYEYYEEITFIIHLFNFDFMEYLDEYNKLFNEREINIIKKRFQKFSVKDIALELNISSTRVSQVEEKAKEKFLIFYMKNEFLLKKIINSLIKDIEKTNIKKLGEYINEPIVFIYLGGFEYILELDLLNLSDKELYKLDLPNIFTLNEIEIKMNEEIFFDLVNLNYNRINELYVKKDITNLEKIIYIDNFWGSDLIEKYKSTFNEEINKRSLAYYLKNKDK